MRQNSFQNQYMGSNPGIVPGETSSVSQQNQPKHFMQDQLERKIEKFSSQNANVQKRVNTSSKFRNNNHMIMGNLPANTVSAQHGPGTSGGQGSSSSNITGPGFSKKKYNLNGNLMSEHQQMLNNSLTGPSTAGTVDTSQVNSYNQISNPQG